MSSMPPTALPQGRKVGLSGLHVYQVALEFYRRLREATRGQRGHVIEQISDAAESVVLNISEAHPALGADRLRRFRIAAHEASECWGALDLLEIRGQLSPSTLNDLRELLDRACAMLYRLSR